MTRVVGAGRGVLPTWATLAAESSSRRRERTQSDLRIGLIVIGLSVLPLWHADGLSDGAGVVATLLP